MIAIKTETLDRALELYCFATVLLPFLGIVMADMVSRLLRPRRFQNLDRVDVRVL